MADKHGLVECAQCGGMKTDPRSWFTKVIKVCPLCDGAGWVEQHVYDAHMMTYGPVCRGVTRTGWAPLFEGAEK